MNVAANALVGSQAATHSSSHLLLRDLPRDLAAQIRELHTKIPVWNLVCVLYPLAWFATAVVVEQLTQGRAGPLQWIERFAGVVLMGIFLQAIAILMHEALHGNLFQNSQLNRLASFLCGVPAFFSGTAYKVAHLNHHRQTRTEQDQDEISNLCKTRRQFRALFYTWFVAGTFLYFFIVPAKAMQIGTYSERRRIAMEYIAMFAINAGIFVWGIGNHHGLWLLWYWLLPLQVAMFFTNIRSIAEHQCTSTDNALSSTRTTRSNGLVSVLMLNLNYHLEHHLFPGVPWYNLPKVHRALLPVYVTSRPYLERSYMRYALKVLFRGPFHEIRG